MRLGHVDTRPGPRLGLVAIQSVKACCWSVGAAPPRAGLILLVLYNGGWKEQSLVSQETLWWQHRPACLWMVTLVFLTPVVCWMATLVFITPVVGWMVTLVFLTPAVGWMVTLVFLTSAVSPFLLELPSCLVCWGYFKG